LPTRWGRKSQIFYQKLDFIDEAVGNALRAMRKTCVRAAYPKCQNAPFLHETKETANFATYPVGTNF
jgi:hypothetical protein